MKKQKTLRVAPLLYSVEPRAQESTQKYA